MTPIRIFISSVQREFAREREQLRDYLRGDPLMRRFFDVFLFEDVPGAEDADRHPRMRALIARSQAGLVRRRFATSVELVTGLYAALVQYLETRELLRFGPFDAAPCFGATLDDLDVEDMYRFIRTARRARQFPLPPETPPPDLLRHLNLLNRGRLTNVQDPAGNRNIQKTARKTPENSQKRRPTARKQPENSPKAGGSEGQSPETLSLPQRILALLRQNPSASRREIAATLGTTQSSVRYRLDKLRAAGKIARIGPDKGGYWKVLGQSAAEPDPTPERKPRSSP